SALGMDRDDPIGAQGNDALHPGVLRLIQDVVTAAHKAGRPVTVCGEMAADPRGAVALTGLQVDALSVPVNQLSTVRRLLASHVPSEVARSVRQPSCPSSAAQSRVLSQPLSTM